MQEEDTREEKTFEACSGEAIFVSGIEIAEIQLALSASIAVVSCEGKVEAFMRDEQREHLDCTIGATVSLLILLHINIIALFRPHDPASHNEIQE